jgi:hypothetical protein
VEYQKLTKDKEWEKWLKTEIHSVYDGKKKIIPYKPALEPAFVYAFAKPSAVRSYRKDYLRWKKLKKVI